MVSEETKQMLTPILLETPLLLVLALRDLIQQWSYSVTGYNPVFARYVFLFIFIAAAFVTAFLFIFVQMNAYSEVAGKRYLVGHAYDRRGLAEAVQLELGEYTEIGKIRSEDGTEWLVYVVWRVHKSTRVADYVLLTRERLEDALTAASQWNIYVSGWFAKAQVYPVTLLRAESQIVDVLRQDAGLEPNVPVYFLRDYPGRITKKLKEEVHANVG